MTMYRIKAFKSQYDNTHYTYFVATNNIYAVQKKNVIFSKFSLITSKKIVFDIYYT